MLSPRKIFWFFASCIVEAIRCLPAALRQVVFCELAIKEASSAVASGKFEPPFYIHFPKGTIRFGDVEIEAENIDINMMTTEDCLALIAKSMGISVERLKDDIARMIYHEHR